MKKKLPFLLLIVLTISVFLIPMPNPDIKLRFYFDNMEGDFFRLYYTTNYSSQMDEEKVLQAEYDPELRMATFSLSPELVSEVSSLRLDFPPISQLITSSLTAILLILYFPIPYLTKFCFSAVVISFRVFCSVCWCGLAFY